MALNSGIQTYQILTNDDEVGIPSLSSIILAVNWDCTLFDKSPKLKIYFKNFLFRGLADVNGDGQMDINEFSIACKLITMKLKNVELPTTLPPILMAGMEIKSFSNF